MYFQQSEGVTGGAEQSAPGEISLTVSMWLSRSSPAAGGSVQLTSNFAARKGETDALLPHTDSHFFYLPKGLYCT